MAQQKHITVGQARALARGTEVVVRRAGDDGNPFEASGLLEFTGVKGCFVTITKLATGKFGGAIVNGEIFVPFRYLFLPPQ